MGSSELFTVHMFYESDALDDCDVEYELKDASDTVWTGGLHKL